MTSKPTWSNSLNGRSFHVGFFVFHSSRSIGGRRGAVGSWSRMLATHLIKLLMLALFGLVARWGYSNDGRSDGRASAAFALVILLAIMLLGKTL